MEGQEQQQWREQSRPAASQALVPVGAAALAHHKRSSCYTSLSFSREEQAAAEAAAAEAAAAAEEAAAAAEAAAAEAAAAEAAEAEAAEAAAVERAGTPMSALALFPYNPAAAVAAAEAAAATAAGRRGRGEGYLGTAEEASAAGRQDAFAVAGGAAAAAPGRGHQQQQPILLALPDDYTAAAALPLTCDYHSTTPSPFCASPAPGAAAGGGASPRVPPAAFAAPAAPATLAAGAAASPAEEGSGGGGESTGLGEQQQGQPLLSRTPAENALRNEYQVVLYKNRHIVLYNPHTYRAGARCLSAAEERAINEHRLAQCPLCGQAVDSHQFSFEARTYFQILQQLFRRLRRQQRRCAAPAASGSAADFAAPSTISPAGEEAGAFSRAAAAGASSRDAAARVIFPAAMQAARRVGAAAGPPSLPSSAAAAALPPVSPPQQQQTPAAPDGTVAVAPGVAAAARGAAAADFTSAPGREGSGWRAVAATDAESRRRRQQWWLQQPQQQESPVGTAAATVPQQPPSGQQIAAVGRAAGDRAASWGGSLENQQQLRQQQRSDCSALRTSAALLNEAVELQAESTCAAAAVAGASPGRMWQSKDSALLFSSSAAGAAAGEGAGGGAGDGAGEGEGNAPVAAAAAAAASSTAPADCIPSTRNIPGELLVTGYYRRFFVEREKLGSGSYGQVYLCTHILDELTLGEYAVKKLPVGDNKHWLQKMLQEVKIREKLHHPNIVDYKHSWLEMHRSNQMCPWVPWLFVLMEYCNGGSLEALIWDRGVDLPPSRFLSDDQIWVLLLDVLLGLQHLHQSAILYRDMKPSNVLLQHLQQRLTGQLQCRALLADFGTAELLGEREKAGREATAGRPDTPEATATAAVRHRGYTGTIEFTAPEVLQTDRCGLYGAECDTKSDMWSLGIILYAMCYARLPYLDKEPAACRRLILAHQALHLPADPPRHPTLKLLIQALTSKDPALRPSTDEVLEDPRVREIMNDRPRLERAGEELALLLQQRLPHKTPCNMHQQSGHATAETSPGRAGRARRKVLNSGERGIPRRSFMASLPPIHPPAATEERENVRVFPPAEGAVALSARDSNLEAINLSMC